MMLKPDQKVVCIANMIHDTKPEGACPIKKGDIVTIKEIAQYYDRIELQWLTTLLFYEVPKARFEADCFRPIDESERFAEQTLSKIKEGIKEIEPVLI